MMKSDSIIYLLSLAPKLNINNLSSFEGFTINDTSLLNEALISNNKEIILSLKEDYSSVFAFDNIDLDYIPADFFNERMFGFFSDTLNQANYIKSLFEKYSNRYANNLIIFSNAIGIKSTDILQIFNLLAKDDENIVIGKAANNRVTFLGFNSFNLELFEKINWNKLEYERLLQQVNQHENFLHVMDNFFIIENLNDFRTLYIELSKKESLSYCGQSMHEKFTHLFIEYKELLK